MFRLLGIILLAVFGCSGALTAGHWQAGLARVSITPDFPIWLGGYAARTEPSKGVAREIFARSLVLADSNGNRAVMVSVESLGFPATFTRRIASRVENRFGIASSQLLINASHTHSAPAMGDTLPVAYRMSPQEWEKVSKYTNWTEDRIVEAVGKAITNMTPARLSYGQTSATFAVNRRVEGPDGHYLIGANRLGPVDQRVPFLVIDNLSGDLQGIVLGYACHNTTLRGDNLEIHGDYSGVAQAWLEKRFPGSIALFLAGTAGDANPYPRGTRELAEEHGRNLGETVSSALSGPLTPIEGELGTAYDTTPIAFETIPTRAELVERLSEEPGDYFRRRHAQLMLERLENGSLSGTYDYPIQVWELGRALTLVGLAGEVVVDYGIRLEKELRDGRVWVAGYCNDIFAYIPSQRILREGGYEAETSMIYYGQPGRFAIDVEDRIVSKVRELVERLRNPSSR